MNAEDVKIDSVLSLEEALAQNPTNPAPQDILDIMEMAVVRYVGFDGHVHQGQIVMNKNVIDDVKKFFELALEIKFPIKSVIPISDAKYKWNDELSCGDNNSSGFNYRNVSGKANKLSKHALGLAFDINPIQNIYVRYDESLNEVFKFPASGVYDKNTPGTLVVGDLLVSLMKKLGWDWGGDWTKESGREDYQHFEKTL